MNESSTQTRLDVEKLKRVAEVLKAIAHPVRLNVLEELREHKTLTVSELMKKTNTEQSLLSNHLIKMKDKGILKSNRIQKNIYYSLTDESLLKIFTCMEDCSVIWIFLGNYIYKSTYIHLRASGLLLPFKLCL